MLRSSFRPTPKSDLVIGMRGHSVICAVGLRVPCVAISTHAKVSGFMRKCALDHWSIPGPDHFERTVRQACQQLLDDPSAQFPARDTATAGFHNRFAQFMARAWSLTGSAPVGSMRRGGESGLDAWWASASLAGNRHGSTTFQR